MTRMYHPNLNMKKSRKPCGVYTIPIPIITKTKFLKDNHPSRLTRHIVNMLLVAKSKL